MKLSTTTILVIGFSVSIPVLCFGWFMHAAPNKEKAQMLRDTTAQLNLEAAKQRQADEKFAQAVQMVRVKAAEWSAIYATRTPPDSVAAGGINLAVNAFQLSEDTRKFRNNIQRAVNGQLRRGGVEVINGPYVQGPDVNAPANSLLTSFYNYQAFGYPAVVFDLGTVTVRGNYNQIMNHVRAWKTMPRYLAVTDGLRIDGTSPDLTATYNLTIVGYLRSTEVYGQAPEGQSSGNNNAGGGVQNAGGRGGAGGGGNPNVPTAAGAQAG